MRPGSTYYSLTYLILCLQLRPIVSAFGLLKSFHLVTDRDTGAGKGHAFVEYLGASTTEAALQVGGGGLA